jgi:large subunit ribosomal protein L30
MPSQLIKVKYVKSAIGYNERQKATVKSLGLRRIGDEVVHEDNLAIQGMVRAVRHLVTVEPVAEAAVEGREGDSSPRSRGKGAPS